MALGGILGYETIRKRKDGTEINVSISAGPMEVGGEVTGRFVIFHDITERKRAEEELTQLKEFNEQIVQQAPIGILRTDEEGHIIYENPKFDEIIGTPPGGKSAAIGRKLTEMPNVIKAFKTAGLKNLEDLAFEDFVSYLSSRGVSLTFPFTSIYGKEVQLSLVGAPLFGGNEKLEGALILAEDITKRKKAEEALRESEQRLKTILQGSSIPIFTIDIGRKVTSWNAAMEKYTGVKAEEIIGTDQYWKLFYNEKRPCMIDLLVDEATEEIPQWYQGRYSKSEFIKGIYEAEDFSPKQGEGGTWLHLTAAAIKNSNGDTVGAMEMLQDITNRKQAEEQLERSFIELAETISRAMASRDPYTAGHQRRVAELAQLVGKKMGLDKNRLMGLYIGGLLHDIGKISTPEVILSRPGKLSDEEWNLIRTHTKRGYEILDGANFPWPIADMTLHHHERLDGSGYPHGISGDELSLEVRILGVCDVVEAMSSHRPYRPARSREEVVGEIKGGRGTKYDADVVDVMLEIIETGEFNLAGEGKSE
jgi:PAS domain S-box/uncharacterized domain HDIG